LENIAIFNRVTHSFKPNVELIFITFETSSLPQLTVMTLYKNSHLVTFEHAKNAYRVSEAEARSIFQWFITQKEQRIKHILKPYTFESDIPFFDI